MKETLSFILLTYLLSPFSADAGKYRYLLQCQEKEYVRSKAQHSIATQSGGALWFGAQNWEEDWENDTSWMIDEYRGHCEHKVEMIRRLIQRIERGWVLLTIQKKG